MCSTSRICPAAGVGEPGGADPARTHPGVDSGVVCRAGRRAPEAVALTFQGRSMTYRELDESANRLAHLLAGEGVGPGQCVGLLVERSAQATIAMLAVLKTGAAYLPIDPGLPAARIGFMLADAAPIAVITTTGLADRLEGATCWSSMSRTPGSTPTRAPRCRHPRPRDRLPRLHLGHHRGAQGGGGHPPQRHPVDRVTRCAPERAGVLSQCHSLAFDVSVWEIFGALLAGGRLVVVSEAVAGSPDDFHAVLVSEAASPC